MRPDKIPFRQNKAQPEGELEERKKEKKNGTYRKKTVVLARYKDYLPHCPQLWHPNKSAH